MDVGIEGGMDEDVAHWREQALQCRRLVTGLSDQATITTLTAWVKELEAKIAEVERQSPQTDLASPETQ